MMVACFLRGNYGSGSHPYEDIKVFIKHRVSDHLYTILLSMELTKIFPIKPSEIKISISIESYNEKNAENN